MCSIHGRNADTNLTEIHEEMGELLDTQMNEENESLFQGSSKFSQTHEICVMKMKERKNVPCKSFFVKDSEGTNAQIPSESG